MKLLIVATILAGSFIAQGNDLTCFVVAPDLPQAFDSARAVFIGEVVKITNPVTSEPKAPLADRSYRLTFKVEYSWKGAGFQEFGVSELVVLSDQGKGGSCFSWGTFSEGGKYLVYAEETAEKNLIVQLGSPTVSLSGACEDLKELKMMSQPFFKCQIKRQS